jgi:hypothetical protein
LPELWRVDSIRLPTDEPYELVFVDNGSTDRTLEYLRCLVRQGEVESPTVAELAKVRGVETVDPNSGEFGYSGSKRWWRADSPKWKSIVFWTLRSMPVHSSKHS